MPNWTTNVIYINGNKETLTILKDLVKDEKSKMIFDFDKIIPEPAIVKSSPRELGSEERKNANGYSWYDWRCDHWGTKWNACDVDLDEHDNYLNYVFRTAWGCPYPVILELAKQFSNLEFEIYVDYEDYYGDPSERIVIKNNKIESYEVKEHIYEEDENGNIIDNSDSESWEPVPEKEMKWLMDLYNNKLR